MLLKILLLFTLVPLVELALLLEVGRRIGTLPTILLILVTGFRRRGAGHTPGSHETGPVIRGRFFRAHGSALDIPADHSDPNPALSSGENTRARNKI